MEMTGSTTRKILLPDTEIIALEDLPPCKSWVYTLIYSVFICSLVLLIFLTIQQVPDPEEFVLNVVIINSVIIMSILYLAGILNVFCGLKTAYSRKIVHIAIFSLPFIIDALFGGLDEGDDGDTTTAQVTLGWNLWSSQLYYGLMMIPSRNAVNYCLGDIRDKDNPKWKRILNFPSLVLAA